ncbi:hypothetical protein [Conexibacter woesei]|uniref:hypothetical protein n=1 Tax=Conexibacter woesei TaxID=191495 RepID=UPI00042A5E3C|nr:hypothetical protein [Conexibacter woesei]
MATYALSALTGDGAFGTDSVLVAGVEVDVLVGSATDPGETLDDGLLAVARPGLVVQTEGAASGSWRSADGRAGRWAAVPSPGRAGRRLRLRRRAPSVGDSPVHW